MEFEPMFSSSRRPVYSLAGIVLFLFISVHAYAARPQTIPALKQWTDGTGQFGFGPATPIVIDQAYAAELTDTAATFAEDLLDETGFTIAMTDHSE
jgi:hypothetical protein